MSVIDSFYKLGELAWSAIEKVGRYGGRRGQPGEIRFWESAKSPANPQGAVLRMPDPIGSTGEGDDKDLWKPLDEAMKQPDLKSFISDQIMALGANMEGHIKAGNHDVAYQIYYNNVRPFYLMHRDKMPNKDEMEATRKKIELGTPNEELSKKIMDFSKKLYQDLKGKAGEEKKEEKKPEEKKPEEAKKPEEEKKPKERKAIQFPKSVDNLEKVKFLGGSTGAYLVKDKETGQQFVMKKGNSPAHIEAESVANQVYSALGVNVPQVKLYQTDKDPVMLSEFIEGHTLADLKNSRHVPGVKEKYENALEDLKKDFVVDALLGNWDVVGLEDDNIIVDKEGKTWRIDNGGSMDYRAQGERKSSEWQKGSWDDYPTELWSMRERNPLFKDISIEDVVKKCQELTSDESMAKVDKVIKDARYTHTVSNRMKFLKEIGDVGGKFVDEKWQSYYTDNFLKEFTQIHKSGVAKRIPKRLEQPEHGGTILYDEDKNKFDKVRGTDSLVNAYYDYMDSVGLKSNDIEYLLNYWAGCALSPMAKAAKLHMQEMMGKDKGDFYWQEVAGGYAGYEKAADDRDEKFKKSLASYHAMNYTFLKNSDFINNNKEKGTVRLIRTEESGVRELYGLKPGDKDKVIKREPLCGGSLLYPSTPYSGDVIVTEQDVPIHKVFANYMFSGRRNSNATCLYNEEESELIFMPHGIPFECTAGSVPEWKERRKQPRELAEAT